MSTRDPCQPATASSALLSPRPVSTRDPCQPATASSALLSPRPVSTRDPCQPATASSALLSPRPVSTRVIRRLLHPPCSARDPCQPVTRVSRRPLHSPSNPLAAVARHRCLEPHEHCERQHSGSRLSCQRVRQCAVLLRFAARRRQRHLRRRRPRCRWRCTAGDSTVSTGLPSPLDLQRAARFCCP